MGLRLLSFCLVAALALSGAEASPPANPIVGTWKLNVAKSAFTPGPGWRSQTRTYRLAPGGGVIVDWVASAATVSQCA